MEKTWREENERIMREYPALMDAQKVEAKEGEEQPALPLDPPQDKRELP
jgi:hypothetical protein